MDEERYYNLSPSIGNSFGYGWHKMFKKSFLTLLFAVILTGLLSGPVSINLKADDADWLNLFWLFPAALLSMAYAILFIPVINYGAKYMFLKAMRDEEVEMLVLFEGFKSKYVKIILANLIVVAAIVVGIVFFVIPGIIVACRLVFVPYLVMDKDMDPIRAIESSWQITKGHGWTIFFMGIISFFIIIVGLLVFFVGIVIALMWIRSAFATLYLSLLNHSDLENPIPILGVNEV
jgi:hypothetical protein